MTRAVLSALLLPLLILPESAIAQVPEAQEVPAEAPTSVSLSRSAVMEVPAGQKVRRIAPDGAGRHQPLGVRSRYIHAPRPEE